MESLYLNRYFGGEKILFKSEWRTIASIKEKTISGDVLHAIHLIDDVVWLRNDFAGATWIGTKEIEKFENETLNILYGKK